MSRTSLGITPCTDAPVAEAGFFFGSGPRARFGWLHRAAVPAMGVGLVVVPPFGYEAICAQRALRHLAERAAQGGVIALRVDLDGTGNSAGDDLDPQRLEEWLTSIDDACNLTRRAGADRLVIAGVRLGATLAALAACRRQDVAGLAMIAAVPSGKALLREGRVLQMTLGLKPSSAVTTDGAGEAQELVGFALTASTREALGALDLCKLMMAPAPAVLLVDRDDLAPNDALAAHLSSLGVEVDQRRLPGYVEMVLDPHRAQVPQQIIDATVAFARTRPRSGGTPVTASGGALLDSRVDLGSVDAPLIEEVVALDECLYSIVTRSATAPHRAVILLNAGAVGQIGPNRLHVLLARRLAAAGDLVMRLDVSGIGESRARAGAEENVVYSEHAIQDVGVAVGWVRRAGVTEVAVIGLCSGAYHGFKAALAGQPIDTLVAINPLTFHYKIGMAVDFAAFRVAADAMRYRKSMLNGSSWRKLLRGQVNLWRVAGVMLHRMHAAITRPLREARRRLRIPMAEDLGDELEVLARRGVAMRFIFADEDPGQQLLDEQGGSVVPRLIASGQLRIRSIPDADHTFTARWVHPIILDAICEALAR